MISHKYGETYSSLIEILLEQSTKLAQKGKIETAIKITKDALFLSKYSNSYYKRIYIIGLLCQLYLNNKQIELADIYCENGLDLIREEKLSNQNIKTQFSKYHYHLLLENCVLYDINSFLDLKIAIDVALFNPKTP